MLPSSGVKIFILSALALGSVGMTAAQESLIIGHVRDHIHGDPLSAATIQWRDQGTFTDNQGAFRTLVKKGPQELTISYVGYETLTLPLDVYEDTVRLTIGLKPSTSLLREVTVTTGKYEQPIGETTATIEILKPGLLEQTNTTSIDEVLGKVPGVAIIDGQANIRGGSGFSYGAGSRVLVLVDDIPAYQADAGFPNWDDFPLENMAQMEIVKGASSALYGSSALNGIINLRTAYAKETPVTKASVFYGATLNPRNIERKWWDKAPSGIWVEFVGRSAHW
ncbi:MAG: TonB-dependent receptor plug domain-containing protein [Saprospiraceae bacterium]|nr:TonB-dependent receptor plug domain-containing protein [Saprospiraceae bacterium]